jgi:hypothetical protein
MYRKVIGIRTGGAVLAALAVLCVVPYLRALGLPYISDDYLQVWLGRHYGPVAAWPDLAGDALYRCRATSIVLTYWTERFFGLTPLAYNLSSLLLHIFNTWLVFALGMWRPIGWRVSAVAAAFFAIYEGHQEAVIWYAAIPELLVFFFSLASLLLWMLWLRSSRRLYAAGSFFLFLLALLSKEPGVAVVPLLLLPVWTERVPLRRWLGPWLAFAATAGAYTLMTFAGKDGHQHFHDGTFSLSAPVALVMANSMARMMWIWGLAALAAVAAWRVRRWRGLLLLALGWGIITLLPYSFLTYMPRVPSRHTYFASAALGWIVAAGLLTVMERWRRSAVVALMALMLVHNSAWIWTRKQHQFLERAAPTENFLSFVRENKGEIYVHCFPYHDSLAVIAAEVALKREVHTGQPRPGAAVFCWESHAAAVAMAAEE